MKGAGQGVRCTRPRTKDALQKKWPAGTPVWFYRATVAGLVRVLAAIDAHDTKNIAWLVRTSTGRNVRIHPSRLHRTTRGKAV